VNKSKSIAPVAATILSLCGSVVPSGSVIAGGEQSVEPAPSVDSAPPTINAEAGTDESSPPPDDNHMVPQDTPEFGCLPPLPPRPCFVFKHLLCTLTQWEAVYFPDTGVGDWDLNGYVEFNDIIYFLSHWCQF